MDINLKNHHRDYLGGGLVSLFGLGVVFEARHYDLGSLMRMGPGFYPTILGVLLMGIGIAIFASARFSAPQESLKEMSRISFDLRGWFGILAGIAAFVFVGRFGGLVPATFLLVFISALGDSGHKLSSALLLALVMVIIAVTVFWWALGVQLPLFSWAE